MTPTRQHGYYRVKKDNKWFIALFFVFRGDDDNLYAEWYITGGTVNLPESYFDEIIEIPISAEPPKESHDKDLLTQYTDFLLKNGYCDCDVYCEPPTAVDQFCKLNKIK